MTLRLLIVLFTATLGVLGAGTNSVTNSASVNRFDAFRIVAERNIFNPNRSSRGSRNPDAETPKAVTSESFTLVGTMLYDEKQLAFFDSSSSNFKKVVKPGETIAGYKLHVISPGGIKLEAEGKTLEVYVGQLLRRDGEGEWKVSGKPAGETSSDSGASNTSSSSSSSSSDDDEIVKRLMKKREEELNK